jgi:hypothetical protein
MTIKNTVTQQYVPVLQVLVLCTSTPGTGSVRTQYVHTPCQPVAHPPGLFPTLRGLFRAVSHIHVSLTSLIATQLCVALQDIIYIHSLVSLLYSPPQISYIT